MDYKAFFADKKTLQGENFNCSINNNGGKATLTGKVRYPMLFVLAGSLTLVCDGNKCLFSAGEMVIIDQKRFANDSCLPGTIIMEYRLPRALTSRFNTFNAPATPAIPITGRLETWVEQQLLGQPHPKIPEDIELVDILVRYQSRRLKTICETMKFYIEEKNWLPCRSRHLDNQDKRA